MTPSTLFTPIQGFTRVKGWALAAAILAAAGCGAGGDSGPTKNGGTTGSVMGNTTSASGTGTTTSGTTASATSTGASGTTTTTGSATTTSSGTSSGDTTGAGTTGAASSSSTTSGGTTGATTGTATSTTTGATSTTTSSSTSSTSTGTTTAGTTGGTTGRGTGSTGRGGTTTGTTTTGSTTTGGTTGSTTTGTTGPGNGDAGVATPPPLDCGPIGQVIVNAGPPKNRVNYFILADGFTTTSVNTTLQTDINNAMAARFDPRWAPEYIRYKNFVNICLLKTISQSEGVNTNTIFSCTGDDQSRLANCNTQVAQQTLTANTPAGTSVSWHSIVLNGSSWWNTGSVWMLWSGGNADGPKGAMHEGGHGFHQLADEYGSCTGASCGSNTMSTGTAGTVYAEVNSAGNPTTTDGKWDLWIGYTQVNGTGLHGTWSGSRYVGSGQYRPTANSMMNSLFGTNVNTSFNSPSREQIIMTIWRYMTPIDSTVPPAGAVASPGMLQVNVVDPAVINVDWTIDGTVMPNNGLTFNTASLAAGAHTVSAKAYDNATTDWVRYKTNMCPSSVTGSYCSRTQWNRSQQTVTWTFTK